MIKLCRVDHRLVHGQVAFSWTNSLSADCILVASDKVVTNEIWKTTLKLAKPSGVKLVIKNIEDSINAINSGVTDKYKLLIVVETIEDAKKLVDGCSAIKSVNLGGTKPKEGYQSLDKVIFVSEEDKQYINEMIDKGIEVEIRQLASDTKNVLNKL